MFRRVIAAIVVVAAPVAAGATQLVDGSFEARGAGVGDYCYDGFAAGGNAPCPASAWTGGGTIVSGSAAWGGVAAEDGRYYGFVQQNQILAQTFTATVDDTLQASWYTTNRPNFGGDHMYSVTITHNGVPMLIGYETTVVGPFVLATSDPFNTRAGDSYTLSFRGIQDGSDDTSFIDNVNLGVVPEPATWAMLVGGFALVGAASRRRSAALAA